jgi:hypothetical protein
MRILGLFTVFVHKGFTILIDCVLLHLLWVLDSHVRGALNGCMLLEHLAILLLLVTGVGRVVTGRRRITARKRLA